jgi:hypothetical protein
MATTSSNLVASKALAGQGNNGRGGRYGLKAKLAAGTAILGCAAALTFGGLWVAERSAPQVQPAIAPINVALAQTQAGSGYQEFSPSDLSSSVGTVTSAPNVARTQTEAGVGYLEFQPGEGSAVGTSTSNASVGLREYLDGDSPVVSLPLAAPTNMPAPEFGPQP